MTRKHECSGCDLRKAKLILICDSRCFGYNIHEVKQPRAGRDRCFSQKTFEAGELDNNGCGWQGRDNSGSDCSGEQMLKAGRLTDSKKDSRSSRGYQQAGLLIAAIDGDDSGRGAQQAGLSLELEVDNSGQKMQEAVLREV